MDFISRYYFSEFNKICISSFRFYYEGNRGCKITCPVGFPLTDLQVEAITCFECNSENIKPSYDLYGCICHSGSKCKITDTL